MGVDHILVMKIMSGIQKKSHADTIINVPLSGSRQAWPMEEPIHGMFNSVACAYPFFSHVLCTTPISVISYFTHTHTPPGLRMEFRQTQSALNALGRDPSTASADPNCLVLCMLERVVNRHTQWMLQKRFNEHPFPDPDVDDEDFL